MKTVRPLEELSLQPEAASGLKLLMEEMRQSLGEGLLSVALYGDTASGLELLIVLQDVSLERLRALRAPLEGARRTLRLEPLIMSWADLRTSTDSFPLELRVVQRRYEVLHGQDLIAGLALNREHLRLACESRARTLVWRLRQAYVLRHRLDQALQESLSQASMVFVRLLQVVMEMAEQPEVEGVEDLIRQAGTVVGIEPEVVLQAWRLRFASEPPAGLEELYGRFLESASRAADYVDRL